MTHRLCENGSPPLKRDRWRTWIFSCRFTSYCSSCISRQLQLDGLIWRCFSIKNRITKSGQAYENAKAKLEELGLGEKIERSGVDRFGQSVRQRLRELHRVDYINLDVEMDERRAGGHISELTDSSLNDTDNSMLDR